MVNESNLPLIFVYIRHIHPPSLATMHIGTYTNGSTEADRIQNYPAFQGPDPRHWILWKNL